MKDWKNYTTKAEPMIDALKYRDDYIGQRFGKLVVIGYPVDRHGARSGGAICRCDCGGIKNVQTMYQLVGGLVSMCGKCGVKLRTEKSQASLAKTHTANRGRYYGFNKERLYSVWANMLRRCNATYGAYGDVFVCDEWKDYFVFREWALANGYDKDAPKRQCTIDRINPFGNYEPSNCRWVDWDTQIHNKRRDWLKAHPDYQPA